MKNRLQWTNGSLYKNETAHAKCVMMYRIVHNLVDIPTTQLK